MPDARPAAAQTSSATGPAYRAYVLFILVVVYTFNFIDRQIIGILAVPIKEELGLSDSQLGLMGGIAFAFLYSTLGVPIAWLADRVSRVWIMGGALTVWSLMTALCGAAQNFWQLFFARVGVGVGEAGGVAPAYALISDYFPPEKRARAIAIYSLGIPIGSAVGVIFGGVIAALIDWRTAFVIVGLAGVAIAPIFFFTVREPRARRPNTADEAKDRAGIGDVFAVVRKKPSFWLLSFGASFSSMMGYGLFFWIPAFIVRSHGGDLADFFAWAPSWLVREGLSETRLITLLAAYFYGTIVLVGGVIGIFLGGALGDRFGVANKANYARVPAIAFLITAPLFAVGVLAPDLGVTFVVLLFPTALSLMWLGPVVTAFQNLAPAHMRATASAIFLFINNLVGIGGGIYFLGWISDRLRGFFGEESLRYSILIGGVFYVIAAGLLLASTRFLDRDWED